MTTIRFENRIKPDPEDKVFSFAHNARSWLLLAGFLPTTEQPDVFINVYTGDKATLGVQR